MHFRIRLFKEARNVNLACVYIEDQVGKKHKKNYTIRMPYIMEKYGVFKEFETGMLTPNIGARFESLELGWKQVGIIGNRFH